MSAGSPTLQKNGGILRYESRTYIQPPHLIQIVEIIEII
jgi:hypothetical protein